MPRNFLGKNDPSAVILEKVIPGTDLVFSAPIEFNNERSGIFIEGNEKDLEILFKYLRKLIGVYIDERAFGSWIAVAPPDYEPRIIVHYEARKPFDKVRLLNFTLRNHLAAICNIFISPVSEICLKKDGGEIYKSYIALPKGFVNGEILIKPEAKVIYFS